MTRKERGEELLIWRSLSAGRLDTAETNAIVTESPDSEGVVNSTILRVKGLSNSLDQQNGPGFVDDIRGIFQKRI